MKLGEIIETNKQLIELSKALPIEELAVMILEKFQVLDILKYMDDSAMDKFLTQPEAEREYAQKYLESLDQNMLEEIMIYALGFDQKDKSNLIANTAVSTAASILGAIAIDTIFKKPMENLKKRFEIANKGDINMRKYLNGAKIIKSSIVLGIIYYGIIPMIATYAGSKISNNKNVNK